MDARKSRIMRVALTTVAQLMRSGFEPAQVLFAVPCGLVGDFGTMVLVSVRALGDGRQDRSVPNRQPASLP